MYVRILLLRILQLDTFCNDLTQIKWKIVRGIKVDNETLNRKPQPVLLTDTTAISGSSIDQICNWKKREVPNSANGTYHRKSANEERYIRLWTNDVEHILIGATIYACACLWVALCIAEMKLLVASFSWIVFTTALNGGPATHRKTIVIGHQPEQGTTASGTRMKSVVGNHVILCRFK